MPARHDVAPADDARLRTGDDLWNTALNIAANERLHFIERRRLQESEELALACHGVETGVKGLRVFDSDGANLMLHSGA